MVTLNFRLPVYHVFFSSESLKQPRKCFDLDAWMNSDFRWIRKLRGTKTVVITPPFFLWMKVKKSQCYFDYIIISDLRARFVENCWTCCRNKIQTMYVQSVTGSRLHNFQLFTSRPWAGVDRRRYKLRNEYCILVLRRDFAPYHDTRCGSGVPTHSAF